jgi:hypothetical protein
VVNRNGAVKKHCVLCKNDALGRNDAQHNAAAARQPTRRRATIRLTNLHGQHADFPTVS